MAIWLISQKNKLSILEWTKMDHSSLITTGTLWMDYCLPLQWGHSNHEHLIFVLYYTFFLVAVECRLLLLIRVHVFNVFTLTKFDTCNTKHHKENLYSLVIKKKMYVKMSKRSLFECPYCNDSFFERGDQERLLIFRWLVIRRDLPSEYITIINLLWYIKRK